MMDKNLKAFLRVLDPSDNQTGGGTASATAGAMAASLVGMVARVSIGKQGMEPENYYHQIDLKAQKLAEALFSGAGEDSQAFDAVMDAYRSPKNTLEEKSSRSQAIQAAMEEATRVPLANSEQIAQVLQLCVDLKGRSNLNAASDLECAQFLARAALLGCLSNVSANLTSIKDEEIAAGLTASFERLSALTNHWRHGLLE
jgi:formiminotetrahydrofolate cyclodeaminase